MSEPHTVTDVRGEVVELAREARYAGFDGIAEWADAQATEAIAAEAAADDARQAAEAAATETLTAARLAFIKARDARHKYLLRYANTILPTYAEAAKTYEAAQRRARSLGITEDDAAFDNVIAAHSGEGGYKLRHEVARIQTAMAQGI